MFQTMTSRNIACGMAQEIFIWVSKDVVKATIGLNKTQKATERASKAAAGVKQIVKRLNKVSDVKRVSQAHMYIHKSVTEDEVMMVQDLRKFKPFERKPSYAIHQWLTCPSQAPPRVRSS